ncbi:helicase-related protein [Aeromonas dhakensis]
MEADPRNSVADDIEERLYLVNKSSKVPALISLLKAHEWPQVLVFISARDDADGVARKLAKAGIAVAALHGEKEQAVREQALGDFKAGKVRVLVATDLMARGIHVEALPLVINLDLPASAPSTCIASAAPPGPGAAGSPSPSPAMARPTPWRRSAPSPGASCRWPSSPASR